MSHGHACTVGASGAASDCGVEALANRATSSVVNSGVAELISAHELVTLVRGVAAHVLVADDDPHISKVIRDVLVKRGYSVELACDGQDALERANTRPPDLLVTDVMMPHIDGWSLVRELRATPRHVALPVIFMTSLSSESDRARGFRLGADDYLIKPIKLDELVQRVEASLNRSAHAASQAAQHAATAGLQGDLAQVSLSTVLVLVEMERKTGVLAVTSGNRRAEIFMTDGRVVDARDAGQDEQFGAKCIYQLLTWKAGHFNFSACKVDRPDVVQLSTTHLLMEGARLMDEAGVPDATATVSDADAQAIEEWGVEQRRPVVVAAQVADRVRRNARASIPPPTPSAAIVEPAPPARAAPTEDVARVKRRVAWPLGLFAVALAAVGTALPLLAPTSSANAGSELAVDLHGEADALVTALGNAATRARMRADGIAQTPMLRAGIETDSATMQDLAHTESLFHVEAGEQMEVFQLHGDAPLSLLRWPANTAPLRATRSGAPVFDVAGDDLTVSVSAPIIKQDGSPGGFLAVRELCDLSAVRATLARQVRAAVLVGLAQPLALARSNASGLTREIKLPLATDRAWNAPELSLVATVAEAPPATAAGWHGEARIACWVAGGITFLLFTGLSLRRR